GVTKRFGGLQVLRGVDLSIGAGELRCIIGPNGCGKTTLFNIITGAFPANAGTVRFRGEDITGRPPHVISRLGIARKFQVPGIYPTLAVAENVEIPLLSRHGTARPWSMLRAEARTADRRHVRDRDVGDRGAHPAAAAGARHRGAGDRARYELRATTRLPRGRDAARGGALRGRLRRGPGAPRGARGVSGARGARMTLG